MKVPKYIQDIMSRSQFVLGSSDPGYTIRIRKASAYSSINTFRNEIERLIKWVNRTPHYDDLPIGILHRIEDKTRYGWQYATVTIYDPVMKYLEQYIKED